MSDLLPPNAGEAERAMSLAIARAAAVSVPIRPVWNPDTCPPALLAWLAWAESVDDWDPAWSDAQKRNAIKASLAIHQRKGTVRALELAVGTFGFDVEIVEWHHEDPPADPYTFRGLIVIDQEPLPSAGAFDQVVAAAMSAKNLRSHMTGVDIKALTAASEYVGAAYWLGETITIAAEPA
jgi:phage tail P2-like protein